MDKTSIVLDNIVFSLQRAGGASVYWSKLVETIQNDPRFCVRIVERDDAKHNLSRENLEITAPIESNKNYIRRLDQFSRVSTTMDNAVFHSSCYRTTKNKTCTNVTTVYDFICNRYYSGLLKWVSFAQIKQAVINSDALICISESTKRDLHEFLPEAKKTPTRVIHLAYDADTYFCDLSRKKQQQAVFIGARTNYKNFQVAVEAIALNKQVTLIVVGAPFTNKERQFVDQTIPGRYVLVQYPDSHTICSIFQESLALLYLSEYEGFGIPVLEGMASGLPVIAANKSSIPEVAGDAGILLDQITAKNVSTALDALLNDKSYYMKVVKSGIKQAAKFSWKRCAQETADYYKALRK